MKTFSDFKLSKNIVEALELLGYHQPTKIQEEAIPAILGKENIVIKSKTGSGKTAAFSIPLIEKVIWDQKNPQVLVLAPTRELAMQIRDEIFNIGRLKRIKVACIYGKTSFENQEKMLKQRHHVIVATPGRLLDHLNNGSIDLSEVKYLVIDEADEMLKMGFIEQIEDIIENLNLDQTVLLSATFDGKMKYIIEQFVEESKYIDVNEEEEKPKITQSYMKVVDSKPEMVSDFLKGNQVSSAIIFCNTQEKVEDLYDYLSMEKMLVKRLHGGLEQRIRTKTIQEFKEGKIRYLVATDVAARGLDVSGIAYVINYELPKNFRTYIHRIGRTARMGSSGEALSILESYEVPNFEKVMAENNYVVKEVFNQFIDTDIDDEKLLEPLTIQKKDEKLNQGIFKIHINAGKKTKMRASDIMGTLCSLEGVEPNDIGIITILDISTYVEIMNYKGETVLKQLQDKPIKGRLRTVSKV